MTQIQPMDYYSLIANHFQQTIEAASMSVDTVAPQIESGAILMTQALLQDKKLIACGIGSDGLVAQLLVSKLLNNTEQERPALPALALQAAAGDLISTGQNNTSDESVSRQLSALGQEHDVFICVNSERHCHPSIMRAISAAQDRGMHVVAISSAIDESITSLLTPGDANIRVESAQSSSITELHTMVIHCLCTLVEYDLFGSYNQE